MNKNVAVVLGIIVLVIVAAVGVMALRGESYAVFKDVNLKLDRVNETHASIQFIFDIKKAGVDTLKIDTDIYDAATGLLLDEYTEIVESKNNTFRHIMTIPFEKTRDYKIVFSLMKGERVFDRYRTTFRNLETLVSDEEELKATLRGADFLLLSTTNESVRFKARFYVESLRNYSTTMRMKVVQTESNVLVGENWFNFTLVKGKTSIVESDFTVPRNYNYIVKLEVWRNGKLLKTWSDQIKLAPTKVIPSGLKEEKMDFKVDKFVKETEPEYMYRSGGGMPGFEILAAVVAMIAVAAWRSKS